MTDKEQEFQYPSGRIETLNRDNMSLGEVLAMEQNISFTYERMVHKRNYQNYGRAVNTKLATYVVLVQTDPTYMGNFVDHILDKEYATVDEVEEILMYISMGIVPYKLWIDKVVEDIKEPSWYFNKTSLTGLITVYLAKTMGCSLIGYKKLVKALTEEFDGDEAVMRAVAFAETRYTEIPVRLKEEYMALIKVNDNQRRMDYYDNELSLFSECLIDMMKFPLILSEMTKMKLKEDKGIFEMFWSDPMEQQRRLMWMIQGGFVQFQEEQEARLQRQREREEQAQIAIADGNLQVTHDIGGTGNAENIKGGMSFFPMDLLGWGMNGETPEQLQEMVKQNREAVEEIRSMEELEEKQVPLKDRTPDELYQARDLVREPKQEISNKPTGWAVLKVAKDSSNRVMSRKRFATKEEAQQFKEAVLKDSPELQDKFEFKIEPTY